MASVHFLNVAQGDSTIIRHNSGRVSMIDICKGNYAPTVLDTVLMKYATGGGEGNFGMSSYPTNPITYLKALGVERIWRFILTHPDMDHLDGFAALASAFPIDNFWDSGVRKPKPEFGESGKYKEEDWDAYVKVRDGQSGTNVISALDGGKFHFANREPDGTGGGDGLSILAPDANIVNATNLGGDVNDASYVLLYRSGDCRIVIPGDAHDDTWEHVILKHGREVTNCTILFAPHHGRASGREFEFLDTLNPAVTFFGCASSGHLAYSAWSSRKLQVITNNQAGNVVIEVGKQQLHVYVENESFATARGCDLNIRNAQGYVCLGYVNAVLET